MADQLSILLAKTMEAIATERQLPESTYRLQFHAGFTFRDAQAIVPYLRDLGITHCYSSPYLKARPGSQHGYDIVDHRQLNPEIGTEADFESWVACLRAHGMTQILDVVPNHMGIAGNENPWWNDVLENGPASPFAEYFDISWQASTRPQLQGRVLLPTLGLPYGKVLEAGQLQLSFVEGAFVVRYFAHCFPIAPTAYGLILGNRIEELAGRLPPDSPDLIEYHSILTAIKNLPSQSETDPMRIAERQREKEVIKRRLATLSQLCATVAEFVLQNVAIYNGTPGDPHSFDALERLLDEQPYRLCYWQVASDEINYRRFFDVNELAALSVEREEVFSATHELVLGLLAEGHVAGVRIDHPDGLYDPQQYLVRLQQAYVLQRARRWQQADRNYANLDWKEIEPALRELIALALSPAESAEPATDPAAKPANLTAWPLYVVVEKILGSGEILPDDWPIYGTSGYGFLNTLGGLFVDSTQAEPFTKLYEEWVGDDTSFSELAYQKKFLMMQIALSSELHTLASQLDRLAQKNRWSRDFTSHSLRHALRDVIACFPVYRSYITRAGVRDDDRRHVLRAVGRAKAKNPALSGSIFDFVRDMLLLKYPESAGDVERAEQLRFVGKFQQVTSPVMAKGLEDTACYVYNRLLSLNEVGGNPERFGETPVALHRYFQERQAHWPWAFSATATHDTKRGEDVRARLHVLSELPGEWKTCLARWSELNRPHRAVVDEQWVPDANEEYFLYQTLLGTWPVEPYSEEEFACFVERIQAYLLKAQHESKVHSSWMNPHPAYDEAVRQFTARILDPALNGEFFADFRAFQRKICHYGMFNSLGQTLLKCTAPGVADTYQGNELWDYSLVDPDNRRPVDYKHRQDMLCELRGLMADPAARTTLARDLAAAKADGRVKMFVTHLALRCRVEHFGLFTTGEYLPGQASGRRQDHVFGFARRHGEWWAVIVVPRLLARLISPSELPVGDEVWHDTALAFPGVDAGLELSNVFTGESVSLSEQEGVATLRVSQALANFPVALLVGRAGGS